MARIVVITGCSDGGIGSSTAKEFFSQGCKVYATARSLNKMTTLPEGIEKVQLDVLNREECKAVIENILAKEGHIDILMNNAGAGGGGAVVDFDVDQAEAVFATNLFSIMRLVQLVVPSMASRKSGLIINIGSIVGNIPTPWSGVYSSSKAALHAYSEVLRMELKGYNIDVLLVAPGAITSGFGQKQLNSFQQPENSLFKSVAHHIIARAEISQRSDHSLPSAVLAKAIVNKALKTKSPTYLSLGGKSRLFAFLAYLPKSFVWYMLARILGTNDVGKKYIKK